MKKRIPSPPPGIKGFLNDPGVSSFQGGAFVISKDLFPARPVCSCSNDEASMQVLTKLTTFDWPDTCSDDPCLLIVGASDIHRELVCQAVQKDYRIIWVVPNTNDVKVRECRPDPDGALLSQYENCIVVDHTLTGSAFETKLHSIYASRTLSLGMRHYLRALATQDNCNIWQLSSPSIATSPPPEVRYEDLFGNNNPD